MEYSIQGGYPMTWFYIKKKGIKNGIKTLKNPKHNFKTQLSFFYFGWVEGPFSVLIVLWRVKGDSNLKVL